MVSIEIELGDPAQWLFGIYAMQAQGLNTSTDEIEEFKCLQIGFIIFTISIYFK